MADTFNELITDVNNTLQNFAAEVGLDVTSANSGSSLTDFSKAMGTFINTPTTPWTNSEIKLRTTGAVRGGICAIWYKGAVITTSSFNPSGQVVLLSGSNTLDELCLVFIMYDKDNNAFTVSIQDGATGDVPAGDEIPPEQMEITSVDFSPATMEITSVT